jgi:hypothetical protein
MSTVPLARMIRVLAVPIVLMFAGPRVSGVDAQRGGPRQDGVTVDVKGPFIIGFFPPFTEAERAADDEGISEGLAHLGFALQDIEKCYRNKSASYRIEITRSITLRDGRQTRRISIPADWEHAVGLILVAPGKPARTVFAQDGPSSLTVTGPQAAAEYFGAGGCRGEK